MQEYPLSTLKAAHPHQSKFRIVVISISYISRSRDVEFYENDENSTFCEKSA